MRSGEIMGTREAARRLGVRPSVLHRLLFEGELAEPERLGRNFAWAPADLDRVRAILQRRAART